ncbi:MAG TPA: GGDEF domain-containing protein [Rectinemataceae bacterium]|nr:GGDEF domain-containing protein [Rectinemataceae bacterium]
MKGLNRATAIIERLTRARRIPTIAAIATAILAIAAIDHLTGPPLAISYFYLAPIVVASLVFGMGGGLVVAIACAAIWLGVQIVDDFDFRGPFFLVWSAAMRVAYFTTFAVTADWLHRAIAELSALSLRDPLTKAANWRYFEEYYLTAVSRARRGGRPLTLAFFDVDSFKAINDRYGHAAGDEVLKLVADAILPSIRPDDLLARLGGDEFALALADMDYDLSEEVIDRLFLAVNAAQRAYGRPVTFSIGIVTWKEPPEALRSALDVADSLMYEVKRGGKDGRAHLQA